MNPGRRKKFVFINLYFIFLIHIITFCQSVFCVLPFKTQQHFLLPLPLAFQARTAEKMSVTNFDGSKNLIGTPELKTNFSLVGTIFSVKIFFTKLKKCISLLNMLWLGSEWGYESRFYVPSSYITWQPQLSSGSKQQGVVRILYLCWEVLTTRESTLMVTGWDLSCTLFSRPGQSQGPLYKHLCHSLINWVTDPLWKYLHGAATP